MMSYLQGTVLHQGKGYVIVENAGVGYKISTPESMARDFHGEVTLFLHEVIRDSERELFGFSSIQQLELFWKLISISGVGPRGAQKIVFADRIDQVKAKIMAGDLTALTSVPGVGKKTAQKIILELKGVFADDTDVSALNGEAIDALVGLGYAKRDAEAALSGLELDDTEACIRAALKRLSM
ncbi:MAG: Holliday junction branch migration protein RuvA [Parcubacteria group bacterium]|nr:Holliday junction branch migration protein RuvA [Parcubacteria group bacterium]